MGRDGDDLRSDKDEVVVYCDGVATPTRITDPVAQDVFQYKEPVASNPFHFPWPIYSPRSFVLKFNGYDVESSGVYEHWLHVDTEKGTVVYDRSSPNPGEAQEGLLGRYRRETSGGKHLDSPRYFPSVEHEHRRTARQVKIQPGDEIVTSLEFREGGGWRRVGKEIRYQCERVRPSRLAGHWGLGKEPVEHGTQLFIDGVAVFNRVLSGDELRTLSFANQ